MMIGERGEVSEMEGERKGEGAEVTVEVELDMDGLDGLKGERERKEKRKKRGIEEG